MKCRSDQWCVQSAFDVGDVQWIGSSAVSTSSTCVGLQCVIAARLSCVQCRSATWPTYNTICLLDELVEVLSTELIGLDRAGIVRCERLVENGRDVHGGAVPGAGLDSR
jgi:hypothetical protein